MTIWKYPLELTDSQSFRMPKGAKLLTVAQQYQQVCLWAQVDPKAPTEERRFEIRGTGHPLGDAAEMDYIGSVILASGSLVFHVFDGGAA